MDVGDGVGVSKMLKFFYVMGRELSGELSCLCEGLVKPVIFCEDFSKNTGFLNMEFAFKYEMWESIRHEKFPETHVLATLFLAVKLKNRYLAYQVSTSYLRISRFGGVRCTGLMANLH